MRLTLATGKGGTGKSTSAVHLALGLARRDERVLLVDADARSATVLDWSTTAGDEWPDRIVVVPWPVLDLAKRVSAVVGDYDHLIIDTGGDDEEITMQALLVTDELVIPCGPTTTDLRRVPATVDLAARVDALSPVTFQVLLTRLKPGTRSARESRQVLEDAGYPVMAAEVRNREQYAQALGTVPVDLGDYEMVLAELLEPDAEEVPA